MTAFYLLFSVLTATVLGAGTPDPSPVISSMGKRKIEKNLEILEQNERSARENLDVCKRNIELLEREIHEVDGLISEHGSLSKEYEGYVEKARLELGRDAKGTIKGAGGDPKAVALEAKLKTAFTELGEILKGQKELQGRRNDANQQLELWKRREKDYIRLSDELKVRRSRTASLLMGRQSTGKTKPAGAISSTPASEAKE